MNSVEEIKTYIAGLYPKNARHVKRGFRINDSNIRHVTNHLIEEVVELQAACDEDYGTEEQSDAVLEEAADVLLLFSHLLLKKGIDFDTVLAKASVKLAKNWTTNPAEVTAVRSGFSRRTRQDG